MTSHKALLIATAAMAVVVVGALLPMTASAKDYVVGDSSGWDLGVDYDAWAKGKKFHIGDTLEFLYSTEEATHNVVFVDANNYDACIAPSNAPTLTSGDDRVTLNQAGWWLIICGVEGHCQSGMKLAVHVH